MYASNPKEPSTLVSNSQVIEKGNELALKGAADLENLSTKLVSTKQNTKQNTRVLTSALESREGLT